MRRAFAAAMPVTAAATTSAPTSTPAFGIARLTFFARRRRGKAFAGKRDVMVLVHDRVFGRRFARECAAVVRLGGKSPALAALAASAPTAVPPRSALNAADRFGSG